MRRVRRAMGVRRAMRVRRVMRARRTRRMHNFGVFGVLVCMLFGVRPSWVDIFWWDSYNLFSPIF